MYFQSLWVIVGYFCDFQQHVGSCSGFKQSVDTLRYFLPVDAPFYIIATSLRGAICFHQNHCVTWLLHSINIEVLAISYSSNDIIIAYFLPSIVLMYAKK